ncbi:ribosomal RNA processing protein 1 homolog A-like [Mizuhopecten yessoensis]|uniref:Ribosomal RNA processing protein 1-like B n=1 Tax=Mizuhopecten yessoensis TaxID=6573 RepID=A0A210Q0G4_MIZYE|nr:ribosomal RNA processing protein 1 homolog A-like [Mizuhopecten yessoensis]OWF42212.1 Ribosomal RNA processing protein 1-like B [Mizuhopecten yessoensis]
MGEMATILDRNDSAEIHFAQRLASNHKPIRDRALKKMRKWLEAKSSSHEDAFSECDFVKIWKGLHYCLWMQDKPLLQEELTERITQMVHVFGTVECSLLFVKVFFQTEAREWDVLDKWRVDKFMTLVRRMLHQTLLFLKNKKWQRNVLTEFTNILSSSVMSPDNEQIPQGLRIHLADIYLSELEIVGAEQLSVEQVLAFLEPFFQYLPTAVNSDVMKRVIASVFEVILKQTLDDAMEAAKKLIEKEEEEESEVDLDDLDMPIRLQYDYSVIADRLFQLGSGKLCRTRNRTIIYDWVQKFRDLDEGAITRDEDIAPGISKRLRQKRKKRPKKRKGKSSADSNNSEEDEEGEVTPNKKWKSEDVIINTDKSGGGEKTKKQRTDEMFLNESTLSANVLRMNNKGETNNNNKKKKNKKEQITSEKISTDTADSSSNLNESQIDNSTYKLHSGKKKKKVADIEGDVMSQVTSAGSRTKKKRAKQWSVSDQPTPTDTSTPSLFNEPSGLDMEESVQSLTKVKTRKVKKGDVGAGNSKVQMTSAKDTTDKEAGTLLQKEVEIWIPNKKYKGKIKAPLSEQKSAGSQFAKFDVGLSTPPAFLRKASAKSTPKSDKKRKDPETESPTLSTPGSMKRVSFNMNKNQAKEFYKKTLIESQEEAFNPSRTPDQGILKFTPESTTRSKVKAAKNKETSTPRSSKRPRATDFF